MKWTFKISKNALLFLWKGPTEILTKRKNFKHFLSATDFLAVTLFFYDFNSKRLKYITLSYLDLSIPYQEPWDNLVNFWKCLLKTKLLKTKTFFSKQKARCKIIVPVVLLIPSSQSTEGLLAQSQLLFLLE